MRRLKKGKNLLKKKKEAIADLVQWSKTKVDSVKTVGKQYVGDWDTLYSKGKEQAVELYSKGKDVNTDKIAQFYSQKKDEVLGKVYKKKDEAMALYGKGKDIVSSTKETIVHQGQDYYNLGKQKVLENKVVLRTLDLWDENKEKALDYYIVGKNICLHQKDALITKAKPYVDPYINLALEKKNLVIEKAKPYVDLFSQQTENLKNTGREYADYYGKHRDNMKKRGYELIDSGKQKAKNAYENNKKLVVELPSNVITIGQEYIGPYIPDKLEAKMRETFKKYSHTSEEKTTQS